MCSIKQFRNIFLTLDGHNDPALNINWMSQIKKGKIWQSDWHKKNKKFIQEKIDYLEKSLQTRFVSILKFSEKNKKILNYSKQNLKKKLIEFIKDGKISKSDQFASLLILLNEKYFRNFEISYYIRLTTELVDNELIFNILSLSDLKKLKHYPHSMNNYNSDFLKYNFKIFL